MRLEITKFQQVKIVIIMSIVFYAIWHFGRAYQIKIDSVVVGEPYDRMAQVCAQAGGYGQMQGHDLGDDKYVYAYGCVYSNDAELKVESMSITGLGETTSVTIK